MESRKFFQNFFGVLLCFSVITSITCSSQVNDTSLGISRNHVSVWFDYSVRYYDHESEDAYSKEDLSIMVDLVSTRFGKIVLAGAPVVDKLPLDGDKIPHSRILVPSVVAEHNEKFPERKMQVIVSFDVAKIPRTQEVTSFDVAKYMADKANEIQPETVTTLWMDMGFSFLNSYLNRKDSTDQLVVAREKINNPESKFGYVLGVLMDLRDCGHFKGKLGQRAREYLPHVEVITLLLSPNYHHLSFNSDILHKMFITKFEDCEKKLQAEKAGVKVIPAVLRLTRSWGSSSRFVQGWQMMSNWAEKNDREVVMFEAFDTPNGHQISDQGWWKLKDKAEHKISMEGFIEKIQEIKANNSKSDGGNIYSEEDDSDEDSTNPTTGKSKGRKRPLQSSTSSYIAIPNAVYVVLILLTVICTLLVAVIAGLVYGFHSIMLRRNNNTILHDANRATTSRRGGSVHSRSNGYHRHHETEDDSTNLLNGSVLEIRDTDPIVAVTYRKGEE